MKLMGLNDGQKDWDEKVDKMDIPEPCKVCFKRCAGCPNYLAFNPCEHKGELFDAVAEDYGVE